MELGIEDKVLFLGMRTDIPDVLQAMDVFTLASLWEGLPVTGIEAQAAGLYCVVSDGVTEEMNAINMVQYIPLSAPKQVWADALLSAAQKERHDTYEEIKRCADKVTYTSEHYFRGCMQKRNRHLVDNSSACICYLSKPAGGTAYTVDHARRCGLQVINIAGPDSL